MTASYWPGTNIPRSQGNCFDLSKLPYGAVAFSDIPYFRSPGYSKHLSIGGAPENWRGDGGRKVHARPKESNNIAISLKPAYGPVGMMKRGE